VIWLLDEGVVIIREVQELSAVVVVGIIRVGVDMFDSRWVGMRIIRCHG
jgi:hypothetical protein